MTVRETVSATKQRYGKSDLKELFAGASKIVVARGKKVLTLDPEKDPTADIAEVVLGPTGNLRAPALRKGKTWIVGFNEEAYAGTFAG